MLEEPPILTLIKSYPRPSEAQINAFKNIPTGFVCDALDGVGALDTRITPIGAGRDFACVAVGPALVANNGPREILATLAAVHQIQKGDIIIAGFDGYQGCAAAGDQVLGMIKNAGGAGFVTDGPLRDYEGIVEVGLPTWCTGLNPNSPFSNGPAIVGGSIVIGGQTVSSGDLIVADTNGVVVVPYAKIDAVIAQLKPIKAAEDILEAKVKSGFHTPLDIEAMLKDGRAVEK